MESKEALKIAEIGNNSLNDLLKGIKAMANSGNRYASWCKKEKVIREYEINELKKLGYTIVDSEENFRVEW